MLEHVWMWMGKKVGGVTSDVRVQRVEEVGVEGQELISENIEYREMGASFCVVCSILSPGEIGRVVESEPR